MLLEITVITIPWNNELFLEIISYIEGIISYRILGQVEYHSTDLFQQITSFRYFIIINLDVNIFSGAYSFQWGSDIQTNTRVNNVND